MPSTAWNAPKAKVQLRISCQRLRTVQQKGDAQAKSNRRDIATLVEKGKLETARIKVENIINQDIHQELLELLELYCELLLARFGVLDQSTREPDPAVSEGVNAIIFSAHRTELKELHVLREILMHKYGRDYAIKVMDNEGGCVPDRIVRKLSNTTPSPELVDAYLYEITKAYNINWTPPTPAYEDTSSHTPDVRNHKEHPDSPLEIRSDVVVKPAEEKAVPRLPDMPPAEGESTPPKAKSSDSLPTVDDFDELTKRFAALKKR